MKQPTYYIGLSNSCHDPALAIVGPDGEVLFAEGTERYLQNKRAWNCQPDALFRVPELIKTYCKPDARFVVATTWTHKVYLLSQLYAMSGRLTAKSLVKSNREKPSIFVTERYEYYWMMSMMLNSMREAGKNFAVQMWRNFSNNNVTFIRKQHHLTHAATACYLSPFDEAACIVVDGFGEFGSISLFRYDKGAIKPLKYHFGPGSLGFLYSKVTQLCGFDWRKGEEWKTMGLAAFGQLDPGALDLLRETVKIKGTQVVGASPRKLENVFERLDKAIHSNGKPASEHKADLAFTGQYLFAEIMDSILHAFHKQGISDNLVLSGGCALNSSYNGQLTERTPFKRLFVPSAPADDGAALGAALLAFHDENPGAARKPAVASPYLGSPIPEAGLNNMVRFGRIPKLRHLPDSIESEVARLLSEEKLVGWMQGRAEFGPRALGNRSILADPRPAGMKDKINSLVKFREEFRPFAPSILHEYGDRFFENYQDSPYMERTLRFREEVKQLVPAVVHVNGTGRLQSVTKERNERYFKLIDCFRELTGVPVVLNTSLNVMGKPIAHSVEDALTLFYTAGLDALAIGDYLIEK